MDQAVYVVMTVEVDSCVRKQPRAIKRHIQ